MKRFRIVVSQLPLGPKLIVFDKRRHGDLGHFHTHEQAISAIAAALERENEAKAQWQKKYQGRRKRPFNPLDKDND